MNPSTTLDPAQRVPPGGGLALVLSGGGALAAYQVGVLRYVARCWPTLEVPLLTGVSAGAINAAALGAFQGEFASRIAQLGSIWSRVMPQRVFRAGAGEIARQTLRWGLRLLSGGMPAPNPRSLLDTAPLRDFLLDSFGAPDGSLPGLRENVARGAPRAIAISASKYATGESVTWVHGQTLQSWRREHRTSVQTELRIEHVLASAALPLAFPAVQVANDWYGDGGILLTAPMSPAIHLGADRILAISTRFAGRAPDQADGDGMGYPPPARIAGTLLNALFLDQFDADTLRIERINQLIAGLPEERRGGMRILRLLVLRPSRELTKLANRHEAQLPHALRFMARGLGTRRSERNELLSLLMFQGEYTQELMALGEADGAARHAELEELVAGVPVRRSGGNAPPGVGSPRENASAGPEHRKG